MSLEKIIIAEPVFIRCDFYFLGVDILLIVVITCMTLGLVVFIIGFWQYHLNWVKARKLELLKARNRRRLKPKKRQRNNQKKIS